MTQTDRILNSNHIIGANLRAIREQRKCSQVKLAKILGISFQQLQKYETGLNRLSAERLHSLHLYFKIPYDYFFHGLQGEAHTEMSIFYNDRIALETLDLIKNMPDIQKNKTLQIVKILAA